MRLGDAQRAVDEKRLEELICDRVQERRPFLTTSLVAERLSWDLRKAVAILVKYADEHQEILQKHVVSHCTGYDCQVPHDTTKEFLSEQPAQIVVRECEHCGETVELHYDDAYLDFIINAELPFEDVRGDVQSPRRTDTQEQKRSDYQDTDHIRGLAPLFQLHVEKIEQHFHGSVAGLGGKVDNSKKSVSVHGSEIGGGIALTEEGHADASVTEHASLPSSSSVPTVTPSQPPIPQATARQSGNQVAPRSSSAGIDVSSSSIAGGIAQTVKGDARAGVIKGQASPAVAPTSAASSGHTWAFAATVIAALIAGGVALWIHYDKKEPVQQAPASSRGTSSSPP